MGYFGPDRGYARCVGIEVSQGASGGGLVRCLFNQYANERIAIAAKHGPTIQRSHALSVTNSKTYQPSKQIPATAAVTVNGEVIRSSV